MRTPTMNIPVSKCLDLASHACRMFSKFPQNTVLASLTTRLEGAASALAAAQDTYEVAIKDILPSRVDVKYENYVSDRRIRLCQQKAEMADGKRGGHIASLVYPEGSATIVRLVGASQVQAMRDLEGRLAAAEAFWTEAKSEKADIEKLRASYQAALDGRQAAGQKARDLRAARDAAKEQFLTTYAEVMSRVGAEFPRDKVMQELFFDEVRTKSAVEAADQGGEGEGGEGGEEEAKPT
ncbi:hypothetical protein [Polyangium aurulentum]|uniref:hypothetical protein n=1 Tax=Polyangium aurulentum TaxID=2567896 RepID=UPI0010AE0C4D|nr:hypothetical protein [Polyangium aurulentum]UQA56199.1 hypothetical protein E8A73_033510 [Polyangium aurulentum]